MKIAKRKRDLAEKKKKGDKPDEEPQEDEDDSDPLAAQRARLKQVLERYSYYHRLQSMVFFLWEPRISLF